MKNKLFRFVPIITVIVLILFWWLLSFSVNAEIILPSPIETIKKIFAFFRQKSFYSTVFTSFLRTVTTFCIAFLTAVVCALASSVSRVAEKSLSVITLVFKAVPTMSIIFLCVIWLGGNISPIIVCFLVVFPMLYVNILSQIKACDNEVEEMSKAFKVPLFVRIKQYYLPTVISKSFDDIVSTLSFCIKLMISAEAICRTRRSLGFLMTISKEGLETAELFAYTVVCILLSLLLELFCKAIRYFIRRARYGKR